jgi:hypothetical protein
MIRLVPIEKPIPVSSDRNARELFRIKSVAVGTPVQTVLEGNLSELPLAPVYT